MPFASGIILPKRLYNGQLSNSNATLYTVPAGSGNTGCMTIVKSFWILNCDSSDHTYTIYHVVAGGSAADSNALFKTITILANSVERIPCSNAMSTSMVSGTLTGDTIQG